MKVMISYPPLEGKGSPMLTQNRQFQWFHVPSFIFPMVPAYGATMLKNDGFEVIWSDAIAESISPDDYYAGLYAERPELIAFETKTPVVKQHWRIINQIKDNLPDTRIVLMGDHVTAKPEESMENSRVDYIITGGDFDFSLLSIARCLRDGGEIEKGIYFRDQDRIQSTGSFELSHALDELPLIDRELTKAELYGEKWKKRKPFYYTMAGRDCPWSKCSFCAWTVTFPEFRKRSSESLLDEIGYLIDTYGVREIFDDTGTFPGGDWLIDFCRGMIERGYHKKILFSCNMRFDFINEENAAWMEKAGFRKIKSGLESANQRTLDRINKGIKVEDIVKGCQTASRHNLDVHLTVMVGYPWETREEIGRTIDLAKKLMREGHAEMLQATVVVPYPGTLLYDEALKNHWFRINPDEYERYDMSETVFHTPGISPEEISNMCRQVYKSFLSPKFIINNLMKIRSFEDIDYLRRGTKAVFGHLKDFLAGRP